MKNHQGPDKYMHRYMEVRCPQVTEKQKIFYEPVVYSKKGWLKKRERESSENNLMRDNYRIQEYLADRKENWFGKGSVLGSREVFIWRGGCSDLAGIRQDIDMISFCEISQVLNPRVLRQKISQLEHPVVAQAPAKLDTLWLEQ